MLFSEPAGTLLLPSPPRGEGGRTGFTIVELLVCLAVLMVVMLLIAQTAGWSAAERSRAAARRAAHEAATNVLESARAVPFAGLTEAWAKARTLPTDDVFLPADAALAVKVEPDEKFAPIKRVTVEVRWQDASGPEETVRLVGLVGPRERQEKEEKK